MRAPRTLLLPGMGADGRLFPEPWSALSNPVRIAWPVWRGETTLGDVAARLIAEHDIGPEDRLVGVSLGGMVACEIANRTKVADVALIGSASSPAGVSSTLKFVRPLIDVVPLLAAQWLCHDSERLERRMFAETDARFLRAMCHAIFRWEGLRSGAIRPFRIHGGHDRVIPCPVDVDVRIDAGHMVSVTHPKACVAALVSREA